MSDQVKLNEQELGSFAPFFDDAYRGAEEVAPSSQGPAPEPDAKDETGLPDNFDQGDGK